MIVRQIERPIPIPGLLGRKKRLKQVGFDVLRYARPGIAGHHHHVVSDRGVRYDKLAPRRLRHRLKGVAKQVYQNLLNLDLVDQHEVELGVQAEAKLNVLLAGARQAECAGFFYEF